jgi:hypothetical protein
VTCARDHARLRGRGAEGIQDRYDGCGEADRRHPLEEPATVVRARTTLPVADRIVRLVAWTVHVHRGKLPRS